MSGWQQIAIAVLVFLGGSGGLVALIRTFMDRPKTRADAVKIIADAASVTVANISERLERVEEKAETQGQQLDDNQHQISQLTDHIARVEGWADRHVPYDMAVQGIAREHMVSLPPLEPFPKFSEWRPRKRKADNA